MKNLSWYPKQTTHQFLTIYSLRWKWIVNNYWVRLSKISWFVSRANRSIICRSRTLRQIIDLRASEKKGNIIDLRPMKRKEKIHRMILVDICRTAKRRGKYPPLFTDIEVVVVNHVTINRKMIDFRVSRVARCSEVNSTWLITSELANKRAPKALFARVVYTKQQYCNAKFFSGQNALYISY